MEGGGVGATPSRSMHDIVIGQNPKRVRQSKFERLSLVGREETFVAPHAKGDVDPHQTLARSMTLP